MPEVQEQGGQGEAKGYTESGTKKAKGGEEMTRLICAPIDNPEMIYLAIRKPKIKKKIRRWRNWIRAWNCLVIAAFRRAKK